MVHQKFRYANTLGQDHLSQRWRSDTFMGPHNNFFRKKSCFLNNLSLDHILSSSSTIYLPGSSSLVDILGSSSSVDILSLFCTVDLLQLSYQDIPWTTSAVDFLNSSLFVDILWWSTTIDLPKHTYRLISLTHPHWFISFHYPLQLTSKSILLVDLL